MKITIKSVASKLLLGLITFGGVTACSDDYLDQKKLGSETSEVYFNSQDKAINSLTAAYSDLKDYRFGWTYWAFGETLSDNAVYSGSDGDHSGFEQLKTFNANAADSKVTRKWYMCYRGINKSTQTIEGVEKMETSLFESEALKNRIISEARVLRAFYHFELVRAYGKVPIVDHLITTTSEKIYPSEIADVYKFIKAELEKAIPLLTKKKDQPASDKGRVSRGFAQALLAKANLYTKDYKLAKEWAKKVIDSKNYELDPDYAHVFTKEGENGIESLFEINFINSATSDNTYRNNGNFQTLFMLPRNITYGYGINQPSTDLAKAFDDAGDKIRKDATLLCTQEVYDLELADLYKSLDTEVNKHSDADLKAKYAAYKTAIKDKFNTAGIKTAQTALSEKIKALPTADKVVIKYNELVKGQDKLTFNRTGYYQQKMYVAPSERATKIKNNENNIRIMRYSEVLLMYAEACYYEKEEGNAVKALNEVRKRVSLPALSLSGGKLLSAIYLERRLELAGENDRYHELLRTERANILPHWTEAKKYWPIPQTEIDKTNWNI